MYALLVKTCNTYTILCNTFKVILFKVILFKVILFKVILFK